MVRVVVDGVIYGMQKRGGINRYFTEILCRIGNNRDDVEFILHLPRGCGDMIPNGRGIRSVSDLNLRPGRVFNGPSRWLSKMRVRRAQPRIFHSTYYTTPYWSGLRSVVTVYDFIHEKFPSLLGKRPFTEQKRAVLERADVVVAISDCTKDDVLRYTDVDEAKISVIYPGVGDGFLCAQVNPRDARRFRDKHKLGDPYWLYVGRRESYKNFGNLVRAFVRVGAETGGHLLAVGGGDRLEPWQVDVVVRNRLERRVHVVSDVEDDEMRLAYSCAAGFVFPSLDEGFGIPLLEAMACGTPIIASDIPVFREVAGEAAIYFDPHDEEALADAMIRVLDESTRRDLVNAERQRVGDFSWDEAARRLGALYRSLA